MKKCPKCREEKSDECFSKCKTGPTKLSSWCKVCHNVLARAWNLNNQKRCAENQRQYLKNNVFMCLYKTMKTTAQRRRQKLSVTPKDLAQIWEDQKGICYWSGMSMDKSSGGWKNPKAVSVDRLDVTQPYSVNNIVLCCAWTNFGRQQTPVIDWIKFLKELKLKGLWASSKHRK